MAFSEMERLRPHEETPIKSLSLDEVEVRLEGHFTIRSRPFGFCELPCVRHSKPPTGTKGEGDS